MASFDGGLSEVKNRITVFGQFEYVPIQLRCGCLQLKKCVGGCENSDLNRYAFSACF